MKANAFSPTSLPTYILAFLFLLVAVSCNKDGKVNLDGAGVNLIEPADGLVTPVQYQKFAWEYLRGAEVYHVQIVSPSFSAIEASILDVTVTGTFLYHTLPIGQYEWRVRPQNGKSHGVYRIRSLVISLAGDLTAQTVELRTPEDSLATNKLVHSFTWRQVLETKQYRFAIRTPDRTGALVVPETTTPGLTVESLALTEGTYEWGVRSENATSTSEYSWRSLTIDVTDPLVPVLNVPADSANLAAGPIAFDWTRPSDPGNIHTSLMDSLIIFDDSTLTNIKAAFYTREEKATESFAPGNYYWKVRTYDAAGNMSGYSAVRKLTAY